jgi:hypothetical protein
MVENLLGHPAGVKFFLVAFCGVKSFLADVSWGSEALSNPPFGERLDTFTIQVIEGPQLCGLVDPEGLHHCRADWTNRALNLAAKGLVARGERAG